MPNWNTTQATFSPLNRHTDEASRFSPFQGEKRLTEKSRCFDMKQELHLQLAWFEVSLDYVVNSTTDTRARDSSC